MQRTEAVKAAIFAASICLVCCERNRPDLAASASVASAGLSKENAKPKARSIPIPRIPSERPIPSASPDDPWWRNRIDPAASRAARDCLKRIASTPRSMSGKAIGELGSRLMAECLAEGPEHEDGQLLESQAGALPFVFALTEEGRPIQLVYHCSDVCPTQGGVAIFFRDTTERECCDLNQVPGHDPAWGGYLGCTVRELATAHQFERKYCERIDRSGPDPGRHHPKKR